jgi:hypothetical protein
VVVCLSIRRICFEADERRLQDQVYKDFKINYSRTPIFSFQSNEVSVFEHIAPIYVPFYSVVVVLYACVNECAPMIGLTRIALSFLEALEVFWVDIISLELLGPA